MSASVITAFALTEMTTPLRGNFTFGARPSVDSK
jgi:hypothetical protein